MFLKNPFEAIKNTEKYTDKCVLDNCPDCNGKLSQCRERSGRLGLYCDKCRVLWFNK